jgi:hypothetical protein
VTCRCCPAAWLFGLKRICSSTENCIGTIGGIGCIRILYRRPMTPMLLVSVRLLERVGRDSPFPGRRLPREHFQTWLQAVNKFSIENKGFEIRAASKFSRRKIRHVTGVTLRIPHRVQDIPVAHLKRRIVLPVTSDAIGTNSQFFFGSGDGSSGYYSERPNQ